MDQAYATKIGYSIDEFSGQNHLVICMLGDNNFNDHNDVSSEVDRVLHLHKIIVKRVEATPK